MKRDFALILPNADTAEHEVMAITIFDSPTEADMGARAIYGKTAYAMESSCALVIHPLATALSRSLLLSFPSSAKPFKYSNIIHLLACRVQACQLLL